MSKIVQLVIVLLFVSIHSLFAQSYLFVEGSLVTADGDTLKGFLYEDDWTETPTIINYKAELDSDDVKVFDAFKLQRVTYTNGKRFISAAVDIDQNYDTKGFASKLSYSRNMINKRNQVLLEVLFKSDSVSLYKNEGDSYLRYFYKKADGDFVQLNHKYYLIDKTSIRENNDFRQQLMNAFYCSDFDSRRFNNVNYTTKSIIRLLTDYLECKDELNGINYTSKVSVKSKGRVTFGPLVSYENMSLSHTGVEELVGAISFGVQAEYTIPKFKNAIRVYLQLKYLNSKADYEYLANYNYSFTYTVIDMPIGIKYGYSISDDTKVFLSSYVTGININMGSALEKDGKEELNTLSKTMGLGFGVGLTHKEFEIGCQYTPENDVFNKFYRQKHLSFYVAYSIF